jgi:hypothetical protein
MSTASSLSGANLTLGRIYELHGHSHANLIMSPTLSQKIDAGHGRKIAGSVADGARERDDRGLALGDGVEGSAVRSLKSCVPLSVPLIVIALCRFDLIAHLRMRFFRPAPK